MKTLISLLTFMMIIGAANAEVQCENIISHYEEQKETINTNIEYAGVVLGDAIFNIERRKRKRARRLLNDAIDRLESIEKSAQSVSSGILEDVSRCRRQAGFLFMIRNKVEETKKEVSLTIDEAYSLRARL